MRLHSLLVSSPMRDLPLRGAPDFKQIKLEEEKHSVRNRGSVGEGHLEQVTTAKTTENNVTTLFYHDDSLFRDIQSMTQLHESVF